MLTFRNQKHGYVFARVLPVQTNCLKHAFVQVPAGEEKGQCKNQSLFCSRSSCFVVSIFLPRANTMGGSLWRRILLFCHQHLGLGGCLACSPKGTLSVTSHFPATEFRESWILYRGGKTYFSTSSSLTDSDFPLQPAVGWVIFCEIQTSRVTWLFAVQNEFFWMFLYDLGWGENSNIQASVINVSSNMSNCVSNLHPGFILIQTEVNALWKVVSWKEKLRHSSAGLFVQCHWLLGIGTRVRSHVRIVR